MKFYFSYLKYIIHQKALSGIPEKGRFP